VTSTPLHRPDRPDAGPFVHTRLPGVVERLTSERAWIDGDRNAITLTKGAGLTLVVTALRAGAVLREHRAPAAATLHVLSGRMTLRVGDRSLDLVSGDVVAMEAGLAHAADAQEDTAFLLTIVEGGPR
jgi:quercetin dioxygenase-like cupin family protein